MARGFHSANTNIICCGHGLIVVACSKILLCVVISWTVELIACAIIDNEGLVHHKRPRITVIRNVSSLKAARLEYYWGLEVNIKEQGLLLSRSTKQGLDRVHVHARSGLIDRLGSILASRLLKLGFFDVKGEKRSG